MLKSFSKTFFVLSLIALAFLLTSCSFIERNTIGLFDQSEPARQDRGFRSRVKESSADQAQNSTSSVAIEKLDPAAEVKNSVELLWQIPEEPVESYTIRYGYSKEDLSFSEELKVSEIDKFEDPKYGFVYRHIIKDVPVDKKLYVALAAAKDGKNSELSEVFELEAEKPE